MMMTRTTKITTIYGNRNENSLPVLGNVEAPLELEMDLAIVIDEAGEGVVAAAGEHTGGGLLLGDCLIRNTSQLFRPSQTDTHSSTSEEGEEDERTTHKSWYK